MYHNKCLECNDPQAFKVTAKIHASSKITWLCELCIAKYINKGYDVEKG